MRERTTNGPVDELSLEEGLKVILTHQPEPAFVERLEQHLWAQQDVDVAQGPDAMRKRRRGHGLRRWLRHPAPRRRWAVVPLAMLVILLVGLLIIKPERAWAGLRAWLGYVPGVGFVDLENTRVLLIPVVQTREGVTLRVTEVIAGPEETTVVVESEGLPPQDELWEGGAEVDDAFVPLLLLPDGTALEVETFRLAFGRATLVFPPLPEKVHYVTLELPLLPLVPPEAAPENWSVALALQPATGELVAEMYPQPYRVEGATDTQHGITLSVLDVAHTPERTVFTLQTSWQQDEWKYVRPRWQHKFYDDLGHVYGDYIESNSSTVMTVVERVTADDIATPPPLSSQTTFDFVPVSRAADTLTFEVAQVEVRVPATDTFTIDLGEQPQIGDSWDLDVTLDVAGFPVHITRAWIGTEEFQSGPDAEPEERVNLYFYVEPWQEQQGRSLSFFYLLSDHPALSGGGGSPRVRRMGIRDKNALPSGPIEVYVEEASVAFHGPWRLQWQMPKITNTTPVLLDLDQVDTANNVTLRLDSVTLTDRLTAVDVALENVSAGTTLDQILHYFPYEERALTLKDDRLHDYWFDRGGRLYWEPEDSGTTTEDSELPASRLAFPAVRPLARRLSLQIPAVSLAVPDAAAFTIDVPEDLLVRHIEHQARGRSNGRTTMERVESEPWPVDVRFTIAGYDVHFNEAYVYYDEPTEAVIRLYGVAIGGHIPDRLLYGLRMGAITRPDGNNIQAESGWGWEGIGMVPDIHSSARRHPDEANAFQVNVQFPVTDPETGLLQPGRYQVALEGVSEVVEGPWQFTWSLEQDRVPTAAVDED